MIWMTKFTVLAVVTFTKNEKRHKKAKMKASRINTLPFNEYFSVRTRITSVELWRVEIHNIIRVVKNEDDE